MIRLFTKSMAIVALLGMLAHTAPAHAARELIASSVMMETHPVMATFILPFFKEWSTLSGDAIKITYYNPGTVCASTEMIPATEKGVLAMTLAPLGAASATFPASTMSNLPLIFSNSRAAALTMAEAVETLPQLQKEMSVWKPIILVASVPLNLLTVKKPVKTMEDLKGLKIGTSSNDSMEVIKCLGGTPVQLQLNDMYLALQRGMIDGCILPQPTFRSTKVTEVAKYLTVCNIQCSPTPLLMSRKTWDALPQPAKDVIDNMGVRALSTVASIYPDYFSLIDTQWVIDNHKVQVYALPDEERVRWLEAIKPTHRSWIERAARQGVKNPAELLDAFIEIANKYNDVDVQKRILEETRERVGIFYPPQDRIDLVWAD